MAQIADDTGLAHPCADDNTQIAQSISHFLGCAELLERKLRMAVEIPAQLYEKIGQFLSSLEH
jgi:hypothetical protein